MVDPTPGRVNARSVAGGEVLLAAVLRVLGIVPAALVTRSGPRRRLVARALALGLADDAGSYAARVRDDPDERGIARSLVATARVRFFDDPPLWEHLRLGVLPLLAARGPEARLWCAGVTAGIDALSLAILWGEVAPAAAVRILATCPRRDLLDATRRGWFPPSAVREVSPDRLARAFRPERRGFVAAAEAQARVATAVHDLDRDPWPRELGLVLLRGGDLELRGAESALEVVERAAASLSSHRFLGIGPSERLPPGWETHFEPVEAGIQLYRKRT